MAVKLIIELPQLWGKVPLFLVITPSIHCWVFPSLAGCQSRFPGTAWWCFARRGANLSSKQMKMDSEATADTKWHESELTLLSSICMHSRRREREEKKNLFHFLLIAALPDTHMVGSAIGGFTGGKVMRYYCCTRPERYKQACGRMPGNTPPQNWMTIC